LIFISGRTYESFEAGVITGTSSETELIQRFNEYFPGQGIIVAGSNITVTTGTTTVTIASTGGGGGGGESAFTGAGNVVVISGVPTAGEVTVSGEPNNQFTVTQASHGFSAANAIFHNGSTWSAAIANNGSTLGTHIVQSVSGDDFVAVQVGRTSIPTHGLTVGEFYFVTATGTAGDLDIDEPASGFSNPLVFVEDSDIVQVLPFRPSVVPASGTVETVNELSGDVAISGAGGNTVTTESQAVIVSGTSQFSVTQASHGFSPTTAIYFTGSEWAAAQADDSETLGTHIVRSTSGDNFVAVQTGRTAIESHGLTAGEYYFVTATGTSGTLDVDEPASGFSNPLLFVENSDIVHILPFRPSAIATSSGTSLQLAYDVEDGVIITLDGKPLALSGTGELTAVTGTFTSGLTVGGGSTHITGDSITGDFADFQNIVCSGVQVATLASVVGKGEVNVTLEGIDVVVSGTPHAAVGVFGNDYQVAVSDGDSSTTSSSFQTKTTLTTPALNGNYLVQFCCITGNDGGNAHQVQLENTTDTARIFGPVTYKIDSENIIDHFGYGVVSFTGSAKTFEIQYNASGGGGTTTIRQARITIWRVA